jgi:hypothetical protein
MSYAEEDTWKMVDAPHLDTLLLGPVEEARKRESARAHTSSSRERERARERARGSKRESTRARE